MDVYEFMVYLRGTWVWNTKGKIMGRYQKTFPFLQLSCFCYLAHRCFINCNGWLSIGHFFLLLTHISVGNYIPNSWVMFNWDIYQPLSLLLKSIFAGKPGNPDVFFSNAFSGQLLDVQGLVLPCPSVSRAVGVAQTQSLLNMAKNKNSCHKPLQIWG